MKILFLASPSLSSFELAVIRSIEENNTHAIVGVLVDLRPQKPVLSRLLHHIKKGRGLYLGVMIFSEIFQKQQQESTSAFFASKDIPVLPFSGYQDEHLLARLSQLEPDILVLLNGFGVIQKPLLHVAPKGVASYHHGNMRKYRGQPPGFWELSHGEREMGVTVQILSERLDAGLPVAEKNVAIHPTDSLQQLVTRAFAESAPLMRQALDRLEAGGDIAPLDHVGRVYTLPNFRQWCFCHAKILARRFTHWQRKSG